MSALLIIGIGSEFRHDDAAGLLAARELRRRALPGQKVVESTGDGAELLELWQGVERVVLIDAAQSEARPGTLHTLNAHAQEIPTALLPRCSSHLFSVAEAIRMGKTLGLLPLHLTLYAIEGADFSLGSGLSPEVAHTVRELVATLSAQSASPLEAEAGLPRKPR